MHRPARPLDDFVDCFWHWDAYTAPAPRERALPSGALDIVINLGEDRLRIFDADDGEACSVFPGAMISGAHPGAFVIGTAPRVTVMGVHFKPGGAFPFLGVPPSDLEGTHAPLDALWGPFATRLREQLVEASDATTRFAILERALRERGRRFDRSATVRLAMQAFDDPRVTSVAAVNDATSASSKKLLALFRDEVGLKPKAFWRVRRFQAALRRLDHARTRGRLDGASVAAELGHHDQPHFNREFKRFTGLSPSAFLAHELERPNHVPLRG